jgi:hypothetical protein
MVVLEVAATPNVAVEPAPAVWSAGCVVMIGPADTVSVKLWVALGLTVLLAVSVKWNGEPLASLGVPEMTPVEAFKPAQLGKLPVKPYVIVDGDPVAVTVNVPAELTVKVVLLALVIVGAKVTVSVAALLVAPPPTPFVITTWNLSLFIPVVTPVTVKVAVVAPL